MCVCIIVCVCVCVKYGVCMYEVIHLCSCDDSFILGIRWSGGGAGCGVGVMR